ncbi:GCN5-related N-acetyltransferase [Leucogyrophana mollusca]|uniref:GCN5-related N-acetyltransferase n=1 Tax=Leucogyrophana mollusca TaxID=85980 RepID=A0ACB8BQY8_9AGAM|nr:GCN5-related N-acetyltransferase [Leucogyrophana mollusca]
MSNIIGEEINTGALSEIIIRPIEAKATMSLRHSVLWPEMDLSYVVLPEDDSGIHLGAFLPGRDEPIAVISVFIDTAASEQSSAITDQQTAFSEPAVCFRKFACHPDYQGQGIGTALLKHAFLVAGSELGAKVIWCDARLAKSDWYRKRGMVSFGDRFFKGSVEYIRMKMSL